MLDLDRLTAAAPYETGRTLRPETNRQIFWQDIVPSELSHATPIAAPTVVFLVGQQGAGKTRVSNQLASALNDAGGYVDVDSDLYKPYHPDYQQLLVENDREMAHHTRPDSRRWMAQAEAYVRGDGPEGTGHGINALIQETAQDPAAVVDKLREYRETHRVEIAVLGVPEAMSLQGILHRYHEQVAERGFGRLTEPDRRAASYNGILELAAQVDDLALADSVAVFRRGEGQPRYANDLDVTGAWRAPAGLAEAIRTERARPWTSREASEFNQVQQYLHTHMDSEFHTELGSINELASPLQSSSRTEAASAASAALTPPPAQADAPTSGRGPSPRPRGNPPPQQQRREGPQQGR